MTDPALKVYRKRRTPGIVLRILVIVFAVFLLLAIMLFFGLRRYVAYTDSGRLYLDIPWLYGYMAGKPEDDPLSSELTLTGDSYRAEPAPGESPMQEAEALPEQPAGEADDGALSAEETSVSPAEGGAPEG